MEIEIFRSEILESLECSVIQGSKLSGLFYTIYTNEIPLLYKLLHDNWFTRLTGHVPQKFKYIYHLTVNFVDDSTSIITFSDTNLIKIYLENYYNLLHNYYNINKLKINPDKNSLLIVNKPKHDPPLKNFFFLVDSYKIKPKTYIKILGSYIQNTLKMDTEIGKLTSILHHRLNELNKIKRYTSFETRRQFINSHIIGKINYMLPTYMHAPACLKDKLHKVLMKAARFSIGNYCFKKSTYYILNKCKMTTINNMINISAIKLIHKTLHNESPHVIFQYYKVNKRKSADIYYNYTPKYCNMKNYFIYQGIKLFNGLPAKLKDLPPVKFNNKIKRYITDPASVVHVRDIK